MRNISPDVSLRLLFLKTLSLSIIGFFLYGSNYAHSQPPDRFLVSHFASYTEEALDNRGGVTAALTVITFSSLVSGNCNVSVTWVREGGIVCITQTSSMPPLLQNGIVNHCSRPAIIASGFPECTETCVDDNGNPVESGEGFARVAIDTQCANNVGVDATVYYTLFELNSNREVIFGTRSPKVYQLDMNNPPNVQ